MPSSTVTPSLLHRRRFLSLAAVAVAATAVRLPPRPVRATVVPVRTTLSNGLVVIAEERFSADTVALQLTTRAGSRDDGDQPGINVLTSRMIFQGTARRPSETELQRAASLVGGALGRGTGLEQSFFTALVPADEVATGFDLLSDLVLNPLFDEGALARQKQIALQDQAQRRTNPAALIDDLFLATLFAGHPLSTPVVGTAESIAALTREALLANYARTWGASNLVLTVVGRIRADDALAAAQRAFGDLPSGAVNTRAPAPPRPPAVAGPVRGEAGQQQALFRVGYVAPSLRDADRYPLTVLNAVLAGLSGRLFREVRGERGLAYTATSAYQAFTDAGGFFATAGVDPENLEEALAVVRAELARLRDEPLDPTEVADRISQIAGGQILADETNAGRAGRLTSAEVLEDVSLEEFIARIRQVTADDVRRVAQRYLDPERSLIVVVAPSGG